MIRISMKKYFASAASFENIKSRCAHPHMNAVMAINKYDGKSHRYSKCNNLIRGPQLIYPPNLKYLPHKEAVLKTSPPPPPNLGKGNYGKVYEVVAPAGDTVIPDLKSYS